MSLEAAAAIGIEPMPAIFPFESGADFVTGAGEVLVAVPSPSVVADFALSGGVVPATGSSEPHPDVIRRHVENRLMARNRIEGLKYWHLVQVIVRRVWTLANRT